MGVTTVFDDCGVFGDGGGVSDDGDEAQYIVVYGGLTEGHTRLNDMYMYSICTYRHHHVHHVQCHASGRG